MNSKVWVLVAFHRLLQRAFDGLGGAFLKTIGLYIKYLGCVMLEISILRK